jgi:hypothetical protein
VVLNEAFVFSLLCGLCHRCQYHTTVQIISGENVMDKLVA